MYYSFQADKEFIWLLWKQFQKESPDLAAAVDMVVTRLVVYVSLGEMKGEGGMWGIYVQKPSSVIFFIMISRF